MSADRRYFDETKYVSFLRKDDELLERIEQNLGQSQQMYDKKI